jgi:hypothetical protein
LPHVKRLQDAVDERPAGQRAAALRERYAFKTDMDDDARRAMFPQNERLKGWSALPQASSSLTDRRRWQLMFRSGASRSDEIGRSRLPSGKLPDSQRL